jgi:hypothetical protein
MTRSAGHIGRTHAHAGHRRTGAPSVRMRQGESLWERGHRRDGLRDMTRMTSLDNTPTLIILDRLVAEVGALIDDLDAEAWTAPTPCAEFDAHRLVEHLVGGLHDMRAAAEGQPAHGFAAPSIQLADAAEAYRAAGASTVAAWSVPGRLDADYTMPWGGPGHGQRRDAVARHVRP